MRRSDKESTGTGPGGEPSQEDWAAECRLKTPATWPSFSLKKGAFLTLALTGIAALQILHSVNLSMVLPLSIAFLLGTALLASAAGNRELKRRLALLSDPPEEPARPGDISCYNALLHNEIGETIAGKTDIEGLFTGVMGILEKRLGYSQGMILLPDPGETALFFRSGYGLSAEEIGCLGKLPIHLNLSGMKNSYISCYRERTPFLTGDFRGIDGPKSLASLPIVYGGKSIAVIAVGSPRAGEILEKEDLNLLMGIVPLLAAGISNAELLQAKEEQFSSTLQVMAASIDARDPLTAGHSTKVTEYTLGICQELGLSREYTEMVRVAAMLHDYGKIGFPDSILKKEGKLSEEEFETLKAHTDKTKAILKEIKFEGIFREVPEVAGSHHEKWNGTGYPDGLEGEQIPLGARIIAVADFFEAVTAKRHYRAPMPPAEAFKLVRAGRGTHFDPEIIEAFFGYIDKFCPSELPAGIERRRVRVPCRIPISIEVEKRKISGNTADISPLGIYVTAEMSAAEGTPIALSFRLPESNRETIRVKGKIAWVNDGKRIRNKPASPAGFGIEFLEMQEAATAAIEAHIDTLRPHFIGETLGASA